MSVFKALVLLLTVSFVLAEESLLQPCSVTDLECLRKSTKMFMEKTAAGIPQFGVKPIDPYFASLVCVELPENVMLHYRNVTVRGLKDLHIENLELDKDTKKVVLTTKEDLDIEAELTVELTDEKKEFTGAYKAKTTILGIARYNYSIITDNKGEHYDVGPDTVSVETVSSPQVTLAPELEEALKNDPDVSKKDKSHLQDIRKKSVAQIIEPLLHDMVHNIRASAKVLPRNSFFTDV